MAGRRGPNHISTQRIRIAELAKKSPTMVLTTLAHHIDLQWMYEAYILTRKDGAVGVDEITHEMYKENLNENLKALLERCKSGRYRAQLLKRAYIPKDDGQKRPIGITAFEDKILQRALTMVLEQVYEQDFYDFSYGFRPGRSQHQALEAMRDATWKVSGGWVLSVDIKGYFDTIDHQHLRNFLDLRVRDGVIRRTIDKWLRAGVLEEGEISYSDVGTPQGGVISPLISNIFLHHLLDDWFVKQVCPKMKGSAELFRFADDFIMVFSSEEDARRVHRVLIKRFEKYGLEIHPEKTKLIDFRRPVYMTNRKVPHEKKPGVVDFLGFTLYWGKSRNGKWMITRKTNGKRLRRCIRKIKSWCRKNRHRKLMEQHKILSQKLEGHYQYFGVTGNMRKVKEFHQAVRMIWKRWLSRRSQQRHLTWEAYFNKLDANPLPKPHLPKSVFNSQRTSLSEEPYESTFKYGSVGGVR